jgi:hypothetical protein
MIIMVDRKRRDLEFFCCVQLSESFRSAADRIAYYTVGHFELGGIVGPWPSHHPSKKRKDEKPQKILLQVGFL